jgi:hypothetical protein
MNRINRLDRERGKLMPTLDGRQVPAPVPDNFAYVIPVEDELEHMLLQPFYWNVSCDCHEDDEAIAAIYQAVQDGLLTPEEATDFVLGRLL